MSSGASASASGGPLSTFQPSMASGNSGGRNRRREVEGRRKCDGRGEKERRPLLVTASDPPEPRERLCQSRCCPQHHLVVVMSIRNVVYTELDVPLAGSHLMKHKHISQA